VLGFFVLGKTEDEEKIKTLALAHYVWLTQGQSLFRIPGQVDLSSYLE
jgi:hypothetical protein